MFKLVFNKEIYDTVILGALPQTRKFLWLGTADIKDMYVKKGNKMIPLLELLADMIKRNISIRLIHAKEPGQAFRDDFDKYPVLFSGLERMLCPRVHFKTVIIDGTFAYSGSANITGAGMGAKNENNRNFEHGFITDEPELIAQLMEEFDKVWRGEYCENCGRKDYCGDYPLD